MKSIATIATARKRPFAVLFVWLWQLAWGLVVAVPAWVWAKSVWGALPDGDGTLFRRGGYALAAWIGDGAAALSTVTQTTLVLAVFGAFLGQAPLGALIASLGLATDDDRELKIRDALRIGVAAWLPLSAILVLAMVVNGAIIAAVVGVVALIDARLPYRVSEPTVLVIFVAVVVAFALFAAIFGVIADIARAQAVACLASGECETSWPVFLRALVRAVRTSKKTLAKAYAAWSIRAVVQVIFFGIGLVASSALGGRGGPALVALFVAHQAVILGRTASRASWYARAIRFAAEDQRESAL